jgi:hypothetical protein
MNLASASVSEVGQPSFKSGCSRAIHAGLYLLVLLASNNTACTSAPFRPCSQAGDLAGLPLVQGDFRCQQRQLKDGSWINHGNFRQLHADGFTPALEGQFQDGVRIGKWKQYSSQGKLIAEFFFDSRGVLMVGNAPVSTEPPLRPDPESPSQPKVRE